MKKRILSLLLAFVLVLSPLPVSAAQGAAIVCGSGQGQPGDYVYVPITAENLENLAALELSLYYDSDALEFLYSSNGWLLDSAMSSSSHQEGQVTLTAISASGISGSGELMYMLFTVKESCPPGRYPMVLAVGEAYDTSRNPVSLSAKNGHVTVTEYAPSYSAFQLGLQTDRSTLSPGETVIVTVSNEWWSSYASFDLTFHYDASMFRLVEATVPEHLELYSLNTATDGLVRLTCASAESRWEYQLLSLQLEAREGAMGTASLTAEIRDVYDENRFPYLPGSAQTELTVVPSQSIRVPRLRLEGDPPVIGEETVSTLILGEDSGLAAADFQLSYDPQLLECLSVEPAGDAQFLMVNPNFSEGTIRFSFVEEAGVREEFPLVTIHWRAKAGADRHYAIDTRLIDPVDAQLRPVVIDCPTQTGCIHRRETTAPTCDTAGGEQLTCVACGDAVPVSPLPPLGHSYCEPEFHWSDDHTSCTATRTCARDDSHVWQVNCTVTHVSTGGSCTDPGTIVYTASADFYGEIFTDERTEYRDKLGHDYDWTTLTEPGCETEGRRRGVCIRCAAATEEAIAPLGHDWDGIHCRRCDAIRENPFIDVPEGSFFFDPVLWAVRNGITTGATATTFDPNGECMRAVVVTFLWRAAGSPEPTSSHNPFTDVKPGDFYHKAVLWAVEKGITNGLTATTFGPTAKCNRAQVVTFLWRAMGQPGSNTQVSFTDVLPGQFYTTAVAWAVENGITNGISATAFGVGSICNRAQVVTFLYRTYQQ